MATISNALLIRVRLDFLVMLPSSLLRPIMILREDCAWSGFSVVALVLPFLLLRLLLLRFSLPADENCVVL